MNINRHGIPVAQSVKTTTPTFRRIKKTKTNKRTFVSIVDGVEVVAKILPSSPIVDVLLTNEWQEIGG